MMSIEMDNRDALLSVTTTYVIDTATPLTMVLSETTGTETTFYLHGLDLVAQFDGTNTSYFGYDALGSVRQVLDVTGAVSFTQTVDPYGNGYARAGVSETVYGFTGEQTDSNGFVYLRARYYSPSMGRFMQMDPSRQEVNPYGYGLSNPVIQTDPSGLSSVTIRASTAALRIVDCAHLFGRAAFPGLRSGEVICPKVGERPIDESLGTILSGNRILAHGHWVTDPNPYESIALEIHGMQGSVTVVAYYFFNNWAIFRDQGTTLVQLPFDISGIGTPAMEAQWNEFVTRSRGGQFNSVEYPTRPNGICKGYGCVAANTTIGKIVQFDQCNHYKIGSAICTDSINVLVYGDPNNRPIGGSSGGGIFINDKLAANHWGSFETGNGIAALAPWLQGTTIPFFGVEC